MRPVRQRQKGDTVGRIEYLCLHCGDEAYFDEWNENVLEFHMTRLSYIFEFARCKKCDRDELVCCLTDLQ